jgi:predicted nucleic acid-binding protein
VITCDTSVLIAAFARWHAEHDVAAEALDRVEMLVDHAVVETFSVLTRLPPPRRVPSTLVTDFLRRRFTPSTPRLPNPSSNDVLLVAQRSGISGGAVYDLVVALAAAQRGATLLSLDRRAVPTYEAAGAAHELIG